MATNRDIVYTVKVRNQVKQTLAQINADFRAQVQAVGAAQRGINNYTKALSGIARAGSGVANVGKGLREIARQSSQINDRKVVAFSNAMGSLARNSSALNRVAANLQNLNRSFSQTTGVTQFATNLTNANTAATNLLNTLKQIAAVNATLGRGMRAPPAAAGGGAGAGGTGAGGTIPPAGPTVPPRTRRTGNNNNSGVNNYTRAARQAAQATEELENELTQAAAAVALVDGPLGGLASRLTAVNTLFNGLGARTGVLVVGLTSLFAASIAAVRASGELEDQQKKLQAALNSTANTVNLTVDEIEGLISKLAGQSLLDDNDIRQGALQLLTFRNISEEVFGDVLAAATDLEAKGVVNLSQAIERLGQAMEDPANSLDKLQRSGVKFNVTEQLMIESLVRNGKTLEAQRFILDRVKQSFDGLSKAGAEGLYGALNQLRVAVGNFFENLGKDSGLLEAVTSGIRSLAVAIQFLADNMKTVVPIFQTFTGLLVLAAAQKTLPVVIGLLGAGFSSLTAPLTSATGLLARYSDAQTLAAATGKSLTYTLAFFPQLLPSVGAQATRAGAGVGILGKAFSGALLPINLLANGVGAVGARMGPLGKGLVVAAAGVRALTGAIASNPFGALAVAITAAVGAIIYYKDTQVEAFGQSFRVIDLVTVQWERLKQTVSNAGDTLSKIWDIMKLLAGQGAKVVSDWIPLGQWFTSFFELIKTGMNLFIGSWVATYRVAIKTAELIARAFSQIFDNISKRFSLLIQSGLDLISGDLSAAADKVREAWNTSIFDGAASALGEIGDVIGDSFDTDYVGDAWQSLSTNIAGWFGGAFGGINDMIQGYLRQWSQDAGALDRARRTAEADEAREKAMKERAKAQKEESEAMLKSIKDFVKGLDREIEGMRLRNNLSNQFGVTLDRNMKLAQIALDAFNDGILATDEGIAAVRKKMGEFLDAWREADKLMRGNTGAWRGMQAAVTEFVDESTNTFEGFKSFTSGAIDQIADKWVEFTQTGKLDWKGMLNQMAADFQRFAFKFSLATIAKKFLPSGDGDNASLIDQAFGIAGKSSASNDITALLRASKSNPMNVFVTNGEIVPTSGGVTGGGFFDGLFKSVREFFSPTSVSPSQQEAVTTITPAATAAITAAVTASFGTGSGSPTGSSITGFKIAEEARRAVETVVEPITTVSRDSGPLLDLIARYEGTARGDNYNETLGYGRFTGGDVNLTGMSLKEVRDLQRNILSQTRALGESSPFYNSSAVGRYQITGRTMDDLVEKMGLDWNAKFDETMQDNMARFLAERRGASVSNLRREWQGLNRAPGGSILDAFRQQDFSQVQAQVSALPQGFQIMPTSAEVDPALLQQMQDQFLAQIEQQYKSMSNFFGQGGPRDQGVTQLAKVDTDISAQLGTVSQTITDVANRTTEVFMAVPDAFGQITPIVRNSVAQVSQSFSEFPPLVQEASAQITESFRGIPEQLSPASLGISDIQDQIKTSLASVGQTFTPGQLNVVDPGASPSLLPAAGQPYGMNIPQMYGASPDLSQLQTSLNDQIVSFTSQFAGDTQQMLAPLQTSVQQVATSVQQSGQQLSVGMSYVGQGLPQLAAGAQQASTALTGAGSAASTSSAGVTQLGTSATTAAPQVQTLGTNANTAATQVQSTSGGASGGGMGGGFGSMFGQIFSAVGGMLKGTIGKLFGLFQQLFGSFQSLIGGLAGGGGGLFSMLGGLFHTGGVVGETVPQAVKMVSQSAVKFAPRYHSGTGLRSDERLAVLQTGELVISRPEAEKLRGRTLSRLSSSDAIPDWDRRAERYNYSSGANQGPDWGRQGRNVVVKNYITTPDPVAFNASQGQIARQTYSAMDRMNRRNS